MSVVLLAMAACATPGAEPGSILYSARALQRVELPGGDIAFGWVAPKLSDQGYRTALLDPVVFTPDGGEAELMHTSELSILGEELDDRLLRAVLPRVPMRDTPALDTLRFSVSIAGLRAPLNNDHYLGLTQGEPLYPNEPATGEPSERLVYILIEMKVSDSLRGTVLAHSLRPGPAIVLAKDQYHVSMSQLNPLIDTWVAHWAAGIALLVRARDIDAPSLFAGSS